MVVVMDLLGITALAFDILALFLQGLLVLAKFSSVATKRASPKHSRQGG